MAAVRVAVEIGATPERVWDDVRHVERHVDWMQDAVAISFATDQREGVGTTYECATRVGLIPLTDRMEITEWTDGRSMGVRHVGVVTGEGRFTLTDRGRSTEFSWEEDLTYPWWLGGRAGGVVGDRVMAAVWRRNLRRLKKRIESRT